MQQCEIGLVRIRHRLGLVSFAAPKMRRTGALEPDILAQVSRGLRLYPTAIVASNWVDNGPGWLAVLLRSKDEVLAIRPDYAVLSGLRVGVVAPWDAEKDGTEAQFEVRAFTGGGYEDPVTGQSNASLAQWLIGIGIAPSSYVASQGAALGRAGRIFCGAERLETRIGGVVTMCIAGTLTL